ncbi:hypothetical protein P8935_14650 [Telmatobacter sp. DSM 110680]|uniref:Uncharacterized protein n=1 Tax=Telmatobacter sp. DSM 110680 TaxID=3036704 RepID=A0AAU7DF81_9BACT
MEAPLDWIGEEFDDFVGGQLWRVENERTGRTAIFDASADAAFLRKDVVVAPTGAGQRLDCC